MRNRRLSWFPLWLSVLVGLLLLTDLLYFASRHSFVKALPSFPSTEKEWQAPDESRLSLEPNASLIRYGKALVESTAHYLGPKGIVAKLSNGMNCQNCHLKAGTQNFANPFSATASTYPKYRDRSGRVESILFRINDCMQRSLDGLPLDSASKEMQAMIAYVKWVGKEVPNGKTPKGAGTEKLPFLKRAADTAKGKLVFLSVCSRCHGVNGQGLLLPDSTGYVYPSLWGEHSFNVSAGLYRISSLAGFIKNNMPFGTNWRQPTLTAEQAWDVAAYLVSQPRPVKFFAGDYKDLSKKPVDYPFGPYADSFSAVHHKYGPFIEIVKK